MNNINRFLRIAAALAAYLLSAAPAFAASAAAADSWETAVQRWGEAIESHRVRGRARELGEALARRAEAYQALGHRPRALADLEEAVKLVGEGDDIRLSAAVLGALGQAYFLAGKPERAEPLLAEALTRARRANAPALAAAVLNDQGILLAAAGKTDAALDAYRSSATNARESGDTLLAGKASLNAARLQMRRGAPPVALVREALSDLQTLPDSRDKAFQLAGAGELLRQIARGGADATVSISMRGGADDVPLQLISPVGTWLLENRPAFRWQPVAGITSYRFRLTDNTGRILHEARTSEQSAPLPETVMLEPGQTYAWQVDVTLPDGRVADGWTEFGIAGRDRRDRVEGARPATGAPFGERVLFALLLDDTGLREAARNVWDELARERPADPRLRALGGLR